MPTPQEGHVDVLLSNMSVAYIQQQTAFVAGQAFPTIPVANASNFYLEFPRGYFFRDQVGPRPLGGYSPVADFKLDKKPYLCEEEGLTTMLDDRERANATPPYDPERAKVRFLTQQHLIHTDRKWAASFFAAGVWTNQKQGGAAVGGGVDFVQFDQATSTPVKTIKAYKMAAQEATGFAPNCMVVGAKAQLELEEHPDVIDRIKHTERGIVTSQILASLFGVDKYLVPGGIHNVGKEGLADQFEFIVGKNHILLCYAAPEPGLETPSAGYTFAWTGLIPGSSYQSAVWRGRDERAHSDWFEVRMAVDQRKVAQDLAIFLKDAVA